MGRTRRLQEDEMAQRMHEMIKERCELAVMYAEDGAYASAARILARISEDTAAHAKRIGQMGGERSGRAVAR